MPRSGPAASRINPFGSDGHDARCIALDSVDVLLFGAVWFYVEHSGECATS